jgi:hypothetical protein
VNIVAKKVSHISEENFHNKQSWSANTLTEKTTVLHFEMVSATFENYTCLQNLHPQIPIHTGHNGWIKWFTGRMKPSTIG